MRFAAICYTIVQLNFCTKIFDFWLGGGRGWEGTSSGRISHVASQLWCTLFGGGSRALVTQTFRVAGIWIYVHKLSCPKFFVICWDGSITVFFDLRPITCRDQRGSLKDRPWDCPMHFYPPSLWPPSAADSPSCREACLETGNLRADLR